MKESQDADALKTKQDERCLTRAEVSASLNPHLLTQLKIEPYHAVEVLHPTKLLSPARLDVMAKYVYAQEWVRGTHTKWGTHVYRDHLRVWNEFVEGDGSGKSSFEDFKAAFDELLTHIAHHGFDERHGLIPTGRNNVIIDGAHRLATALALNLPVKVLRFGMQPRQYNYAFFQARGLSEEILDELVLQYCRLDDRVRVAVLFPVAKGHDDEIMEMLEESGPIIYCKAVTISHRGRENLIRLLYRGESWVGDGGRPTAGLLQHVIQRFVEHHPVKFVFYVGGNEGKNREIKGRIRALFNLGNDPVHINDLHGQTISIAESVLNANSLHLLNHARSSSLTNFTELFRTFREWIAQEHLDGQRFCVDGSAVLSAYGLRDANDLDYLYLGEPIVQGPSMLISCHNAELSHYNIPLNDLVRDPRNYLYFDGIKFLAIHIIRAMKAARGEPKDMSDVYRIDALEGRVGFTGRLLKGYYTLPERIYSLRFQAVRWIKQVIPTPLLPVTRAIYRMPRLMRRRMGPQEQFSIYRGFELHYSRGTSLLEWIEGARVYEPEVCRQLVQALKDKPSPMCLDIGANIGLMTLNVLAEVPHAHIVAFEPGGHQAELLEKNVTVNSLCDRVRVVRSALSNHVGTAEFSIHESRHASGDGFFDTRRAGRTKTMEVPVTTLDSWWQAVGYPHIDAVKIDTEGAELWVLEGSKAMLDQCRPLVVFELHPKNIRVYPYDAVDILRFFDRHDYSVSTMEGIGVSEDNLGRYLESANDYVAVFGRG
ncbi:MAG: FkbM family methyltransferase [Nitrospira sp.]|nr:FkbM family methyltransferase [Nitrospira sp.]